MRINQKKHQKLKVDVIGKENSMKRIKNAGKGRITEKIPRKLRNFWVSRLRHSCVYKYCYKSCYFDKSELSYYRQLLIATISLVVSGVVTYKICTYVCFNHIVSLLIKGVVCAIVPNLIFLLLNIKNSECANGMKFVKKIIKSSH